MQGYSAGETPSTTWRWKRIKVRDAPARGQSLVRMEDAVETPSVLKDRHKPFTLTLSYKGGSESNWLVSYGNRLWRCPGWMVLEDVVRVFELPVRRGPRPRS